MKSLHVPEGKRSDPPGALHLIPGQQVGHRDAQQAHWPVPASELGQQRVKDQRKRRGVRSPLAEIVLIGIRAKLAGQSSSRARAEWAQVRKLELAQLGALRGKPMPHGSTWSRLLGKGCNPDEVEEVIGQFLAQPSSKSSRPGQRQLWSDGKTRQRTSPLGKAHGVHVGAA